MATPWGGWGWGLGRGGVGLGRTQKDFPPAAAQDRLSGSWRTQRPSPPAPPGRTWELQVSGLGGRAAAETFCTWLYHALPAEATLGKGVDTEWKE